jgi:hypothetical protein
MAATPNHKKKPTPLPTREAFDDLIKLANAGDRTAIETLAKLLDDHPQLWEQVGDLAKNSEMLLILKIAGEDRFTRDSIERHVKAMRESMTSSKATAMEKLLIDQIVVTWLQMQWVNVQFPTAGDADVPAGRFILQQRESAQRMFIAAQNALATFRKFAPPQLSVTRGDGTVPFRRTDDEAKQTA